MFTLHWQPPYDWTWMFSFLRARAVGGIETFSGNSFTRSMVVDGYRGLLTLTPVEQNHTLKVELTDGLMPVADECLQRIERLLDLNCDPHCIARALGPLASARPGLRLPGSVDAFEQGIRAILGQLVSVTMAAKLTGNVVTAYGEPLAEAPEYYTFPRPEVLAAADPQRLRSLGMSLKRAQAIIHLAQVAHAGEFPLRAPADVALGVKMLQTYPGIGRWTANYFALHGWQATDIFLPDDYAIKQRFTGMTPAQIRRYAERWQPWRSYAVLHIWFTEDWQPEPVN